MARFRIHLLVSEVDDVNDAEEAILDIIDNSGFYIHLEKIEDDEVDFDDDYDDDDPENTEDEEE